MSGCGSTPLPPGSGQKVSDYPARFGTKSVGLSSVGQSWISNKPQRFKCTADADQKLYAARVAHLGRDPQSDGGPSKSRFLYRGFGRYYQFYLKNGRSHWALVIKRDGRGYHMRDPLRPSKSPLIFPRSSDAFRAVRCVGLTEQ